MLALQKTSWRFADAFNWHWRSSKAFIILTICTACFTDGFIYGLAVPAFPFILRDSMAVSEKQCKSSFRYFTVLNKYLG